MQVRLIIFSCLLSAGWRAGFLPVILILVITWTVAPQYTCCKMVALNNKNERKIRSLVIKYKNILLILAVIWMGSFAYFRSRSGAAVKSIDPNRVRNKKDWSESDKVINPIQEIYKDACWSDSTAWSLLALKNEFFSPGVRMCAATPCLTTTRLPSAVF